MSASPDIELTVDKPWNLPGVEALWQLSRQPQQYRRDARPPARGWDKQPISPKP